MGYLSNHAVLRLLTRYSPSTDDAVLVREFVTSGCHFYYVICSKTAGQFQKCYIVWERSGTDTVILMLENKIQFTGYALNRKGKALFTYLYSRHTLVDFKHTLCLF